MSMLHKCTDTDCPAFGQRTSSSCGCHQTDEQVLRAENERLKEALEQIASMSGRQCSVPVDTEAAYVHAHIAADAIDVAVAVLSKTQP